MTEKPAQTSSAELKTLEQVRNDYLADERAAIIAALEQNDWVQTQAAKALGCGPSSLQVALGRHPDLREEATRRKRRGRPRKQTSSAESVNLSEVVAEVATSTRTDVVKTLEEMDKRHRREQATLLRKALEDTGWYQLPAAKKLGMKLGTFQRKIERHPELKAELKKRGHPPGRRAIDTKKTK